MLALGTQGTADADLAGSFRHRSEHDVHDPDPADDQCKTGDADHDEVEHSLLRLGGAQNLNRSLHFKINGAFVEHRHRVFSNGGDGFHVFNFANLNPDFREFDYFPLKAAGLYAEDRIAKSGLRDRQREVDIFIQITADHGLALTAQAGGFQHANDSTDNRAAAGGADLDFRPEWILKREQLFGDRCADHADGCATVVVDLTEIPAAREGEIDDVERFGRGADGVGGGTQPAVGYFLFEVFHRDDFRELRKRLQSIEIIAMQPVTQHTAGTAGGLGAFGGANGSDQQILRPELPKLGQRSLLGPLTDRNHDDDRRNTEDDAHCGEQTAELVKIQVLQAEAESF